MRVLRFVASVIALAVILALSYALYALNFDRSLPVGKSDFIITPGSDFTQIVDELTAKGVTNHPLLLRALARIRGVEGSIDAGEYLLPAHLSTTELLDRLRVGGRASVWVTIPEGFTDRQIARRLQESGVGAAAPFERAFKRDHREGFLFPDTYLVPVGATPAAVEAEMLARFQQELPRDAKARASALHVSLLGAITVASMIEREAMLERERPLIASVIYNRLRIGMPLQIDATIEYVLPHHRSALTFADLRIASPYNTYLHRGLPPGPIANPGRASIEAALHPAQTDFLYYVAKGDGSHAFAATLAEHIANVARYER
ncbi:MAG TPA: endolytic transglycosylase MltG [Candidatus Dormibacteraeota bacterium]|nr:endolytic transglycosylase MltG [Candidatus Dormibacteraeota bacterium]